MSTPTMTFEKNIELTVAGWISVPYPAPGSYEIQPSGDEVLFLRDVLADALESIGQGDIFASLDKAIRERVAKRFDGEIARLQSVLNELDD